MAYCIYFVVLVVTSLMDQTFGFDIFLNKNAKLNQNLQIQMNIGTINTVVTLNRPDGSSAGICGAPLGGVSGGCATGLTQDLTNGVTTFSIASVSRATDEGTWTSSHGSDTGSINITVLAIPTLTVSQTVSALTLSSSNTQSLTITAICAYPAVSLDLYFVPTGGGTAVSSPSSTATCTPTTNAGCADTDAKGYNCVIVPKLETSLSAGTYHVQFVVNLAGQYEPIGLNATITDTVITIEAISSSCGSCTPTNVLAALGIVVAVGCVALCWKMYFKFSESGGGKGKFKCSVTWCFRATIIATVVSVIGFILCIAGLIICVTCDDSVSSSNSVTVGFALAVVGSVLAVVTLVIVIILVILFCRGVITKKDDDDDYIKILKTSYAITEGTTFTIPCSASSAASAATATSFSWERTIDGRTSPIRIDGAHFSEVTTGSPSLTIINASITDSGTYTCVASNSAGTARASTQLTVSKHNKAVRARPDGQEGSRPPIDTKPRTERTAGSPTSASNIKTKWMNNQVSDSNESDGSNDTPRRKLEAVPQGRKLPALELVDARQKANTLEPLEVNETKKSKKKKKRRSKEEKAQVDGEY